MRYISKILIAALFTLYSLGAAAAASEALDLVQQTSERMLSALEAEKGAIQADRSRVYALVEEVAAPHFDFERMSSWVLGKHWRTATPEQKARFIQEFRNLLVRTYGTAMAEYSGQKINFLPLKAAPDATDVSVGTVIEQPGGPPIQVNYSLYEKDGGWKVYDVVIENTSLVTNYRSSFASEIKNGGLDALIDKLAARSQRSGVVSATQ